MAFKDYKFILTNIGKGDYGPERPLTRHNIERISEGKNVLFTEEDPTVPIWVKNITEADIITWNDAVNLYASKVHNHDDRYYTETESDNRFSNINHNHDGVYLKTLPAHNHDERYYTETEIDTKLAGKSNTNHEHPEYENVAETDPTVPAHVKNIAASDITDWNDALGKIVTGINISGTDTKTINITFADGSSVSGSFPDLQGTGGVETETDPKGLAGLAVTGTTTKTITATLNDGSTITSQFSDKDTVYTHPAKEWVDKANLSGAVVISNLTINSLGHATNWTTRTLTPANIGAEPAFSKNTAFNSNFGFGQWDVLRGSDYTKYYMGNITNGMMMPSVTDYTRPNIYYTYAGSTNITITLNQNNGYYSFEIYNIGSGTITINGTVGSNVETRIQVGEGQQAIIKPKGSAAFQFVMPIISGSNTIYYWNVTGDLVEIAGETGDWEPAFSKNTAFNKNFGTLYDQVARGNHTHDKLVQFTSVPHASTNPNGFGRDMFHGTITSSDEGYPVPQGKLIHFGASSQYTGAPGGAFQLLIPYSNISSHNNGLILYRQGYGAGYNDDWGPWKNFGPKPRKIIQSVSTYTFIPEDEYHWLVFLPSVNNMPVIFPKSVFSADAEIEGEVESDNNTIVITPADSTTYIRKPSSLTTTIDTRGVFGIKVSAINGCTLFGTLKQA